jgi:sugar transferase (PEP-CTERM/EpsH1 system associated)
VNILYVTNELPRATGGGQTVRDFQFLHHLARRHRFTVICFDDEGLGDSLSQLRGLCEKVEVIPRVVYAPPSGWQRRWDSLKDILQPLPRFIRALSPAVMKRRLGTLCQERDYDVIHIAHLEMGTLFPQNGRAKRVVGTDVATLKLRRSLELLTKPTHRLWRTIEAWKVARYERQVIRQSDLYVVASEREAQWVRRVVPEARVAVISNGVDTECFKPQPETGPDSHTLLFVGTLSYEPNADAVQWFCREIYPRIRTRVPEVKLLIVGRDPPLTLRSLEQIAGVTITGWVEDVRPYLAQSTVVIVPLRNGGGTRLKILEALAMGKAVVSTSIGAEGLDVTHGQNILIADTPDAFAQAVVQLLCSETLRQKLGENGRQLVEHYYEWGSIADRLDRAYRQVVGGG